MGRRRGSKKGTHKDWNSREIGAHLHFEGRYEAMYDFVRVSMTE